MKTNYLLISVFFLSILFSCKSTDKEKVNNVPDESKISTCKNEVITRNDSIIIKGGSDFETTLAFTESAYLLTISEEANRNISNFEVYQTAFNTYNSVLASSASGLHEDGWYSQSSIWEHLKGDWKWRVTAKGNYKIVFAKLPLQVTPASLPVTFNSAGQTILGPVHLSGSVTFDIACPDAKLAGFTANLVDATTGKEILENYKSALDVINIDENRKQINNYSKTITKQLSEGDYLIKVSANQNASWKIMIK